MNLLKKIKPRIFIISLIIVLLIDFGIIICVAFMFEKESPQFFQEGTFLEIIKNDNTNIDLKDYCLLNWAESKDRKPIATVLPPQVIEGKFRRVPRLQAVLVQLLQNKFNSIVQVVSLEMYNETRGDAAGRVSFLEIGGSYYITVGYTLKIDEKLEYTTAVFKAESDVSVIKNFETDKPRFDDYHFYPLCLSPLFSSLFDKILNIIFVISEITVVYFILIRGRGNQSGNQSGDGSMC